MGTASKDNPDAHCLPIGFMQLHTHSQPRKMVQTKDDLVIMASEVGTVHTSDRYMVRGSCVFSPIPNAVVGDVGDSRTS